MLVYFQIAIIGILFFLSLLSLSIIIDRFITLRKFKPNKKIKQEINSSLEKENLEIAKKISQIYSSKPFFSLVKKILTTKKNQKNNLEKQIERELQTMYDRMEKRLSSLNTITLISPLLGLLGTVLGMIDSFFTFSQVSYLTSEETNVTLSLADGISNALITTALGLIVTIPSIIFYNFFVKKISLIINEISRDLEEIMDKFNSHSL